MLQLTWMSPHKPDPKRRKIDVDLSAILIRSDESSRPDLSENAPFMDVSSVHQQDGWPIDHFRLRIGWSELVNLIFVTVACLIGFFCAPFVFNNPEYARTPRHGFEEVPYARIDLIDIASQQVASRTPNLTIPQSNRFKMNLPEQRTPQLDWNPGSFGLPPFGQTGDRIVDSGSSSSGSSPLHSTGFEPANMSENTASNGPSRSDEQQMVRKMTATRRHVSRHAQTSSVSSAKRNFGGRKNFLAWLLGGTRNKTGGKSMAQSRQQSSSTAKLGARNEQRSVRALQIGPNRTAMDHSMRPIQAGVTMQNPADVNVLRMQNAMMAQAAFHGGGGLGNVGGGTGHLGAGAHR